MTIFLLFLIACHSGKTATKNIFPVERKVFSKANLMGLARKMRFMQFFFAEKMVRIPIALLNGRIPV
ncbi:hypothetical protein DWY80_09600 [Bacteroides ovatus]|nr:hypothetical protein DWY80_09600 [Bacteroides ovatus]